MRGSIPIAGRPINGSCKTGTRQAPRLVQTPGHGGVRLSRGEQTGTRAQPKWGCDAREIVDSPSVSPVDVSEGVQAFPWAFETKYYTATIYLHTTSTSVVEYDDSAENIHGLIVLFNPNQKDTLELADKWIEKCRCDVVLLVCGRCPSAAEPQGLSRQQVLEWCVERSCELIETQPSEEDDEEASTDLKLFSEAMATDSEDASFEELFAKFKDMKVQADKLSGEERKKFAEKRFRQRLRPYDTRLLSSDE
ncbi:hypothetical protein HPB49_019884 [Dermacentor silvarum]|uniref:Uncharacterized protein n=1 Tax=Dermacentor silvarum TaxID=543639 RepID=A0ACB8DFM3_DERSI|nr:hypothetical protein HPB49_019884 [Dermacentor silvarum]